MKTPTITAVLRGAFGGVLMGLANLVPGISGGTMLLAAGVYPEFVRGVAEISTLRFRAASLLLLCSVIAGALVAIVALAGAAGALVAAYPWVMYSLFIGLTLGGVPLLWRMVRPVDSVVVLASVAGIVAMAALALVQGGGDGADPGGARRQLMLLLLAGTAGGAAMILPGVSGAYLLLVLGQYVVILGAIDAARAGAAAGDWAEVAAAMKVFVPVGIGVVVGTVGVSNAIRLCLDRFPRATLGALLGLLLGAVFGLWPFRHGGGDEGGPVEFFAPTVLQAAAAAGLAAAGFLASAGIARLGRVSEQGGGGR